MRCLLAFLCPPLSVLLLGQPARAGLNLLLTLMLWIPGVIHALLVLRETADDIGTDRLMREMRTHRLNSVLRKP